MSNRLTQIWFIIILSAMGDHLFAQADTLLFEAGALYRSGNYEKSLKSLNSIPFQNDNQQSIKKEILFAENYIALHISEDSIRNKLISIYKIDPNFDRNLLDIDISDAFRQRLSTIDVYPKIIVSLEGSVYYILPLVRKQEPVCEECVVKDYYIHTSFGSGLGIRYTYMVNKFIGAETGIGINFLTYQREIQSSNNYSSYSLLFTENMRFVNLPFRICKYNSKWTYKAGLNYRYLLNSDATGVLSNTSLLNEETVTTYTKKNNEESRNKNLFFLSGGINRELVELKNKNWYITIDSEFQIGMNSLTRKDTKLSDINFVSDTYYMDDLIHLCFLNVSIALHFKAQHSIL